MITNTQVSRDNLVLEQGTVRDVDSLSVVGYDDDGTLQGRSKVDTIHT